MYYFIRLVIYRSYIILIFFMFVSLFIYMYNILFLCFVLLHQGFWFKCFSFPFLVVLFFVTSDFYLISHLHYGTMFRSTPLPDLN